MCKMLNLIQESTYRIVTAKEDHDVSIATRMGM